MVSPLKCLLSPTSRDITPAVTVDVEVDVDGSCAESPLANNTVSDAASCEDDVATVSAVDSHTSAGTGDDASFVVVGNTTCEPTSREIVDQLQELKTQAERCKRLDFRVYRRLCSYVSVVAKHAKTAGSGDASDDDVDKTTAPTARAPTKREIASQLTDLMAAVERCKELDVIKSFNWRGGRKFSRTIRRLQVFVAKYHRKVP